MATFPELEPDDRSYGLGIYPISTATSFAAGGVRFSHGEEVFAHELSLLFVERTDAVLKEIRDHYHGQDGGHVSFQFPAIIWQGHDTDSDVVPITGRWKYIGAPDETHGEGGLHNVALRFQYVGAGLTA